MIHINELEAAYNGKPILKGVDLDVEKGRIMGLLGPNGSGKTTMLRCITGALEPINGRVEVFGRSPRNWRARDLARRMAVVQQDPAPGFDFLVSEIVSMGRYPHIGRFRFSDPVGERAVSNALEWTGLSKMAEKRLSELSGGEKQRVFIARAFAQDTELLLLDEPTKNLDIRHSMDILELIRGRNRENGITVLTVLHNLDLAARFCSEVALMKEGKVVEVGPVRKVLTPRSIGRVFDIEVEVHTDRGFHVQVIC